MNGFSAEPGERRARVPSFWPAMAASLNAAEPTLATTDRSRTSTSSAAALLTPRRRWRATNARSWRSTRRWVRRSRVVSMRLRPAAAGSASNACVACGAANGSSGGACTGNGAATAAASAAVVSWCARQASNSRARAASSAGLSVRGRRCVGFCGTTASVSASGSVRSAARRWK